MAVLQLRLLIDVLCASALGFLLFTRVNEQRTLWLLRGYLFLVALAWFVKRFFNLPLTSTLVDALVLACSLSLAILWQGELRRLMELLGTGRLRFCWAILKASSGRPPVPSLNSPMLQVACLNRVVVPDGGGFRQ